MKSGNMLLFLTAIVIGITAGIFICWSIAVTPGLAALPDREYITTFQSLNRKIQNPLFFLFFMGSILLLPVSAWQQYSQPLPIRFWLLLAAAIIYATGVFGLTIFGNVPLNESLDKFDTAIASLSEISQRRISFENPWNAMNHVRSICCTISFCLSVFAYKI